MEGEVIKTLFESHISTPCYIQKYTPPNKELLKYKIIIIGNSISESAAFNIYQRITMAESNTQVYYTSNQYTLIESKNIKHLNINDYHPVLQDLNKLNLQTDFSNANYIKIKSEILNKLSSLPTIIYKKFDSFYGVYLNSKDFKNINTFDKHEHLYIHKDGYKELALQLLQDYIKSNYQYTNIALAEIVQEQIQLLGISEQALVKTYELVNNVLNDIRNKSNFGNRVYNIIKNILQRESFIPEHSLTTAYIGVALLEKNHYSKSDQESFCIASLFHDLKINNNLANIELGALKLEDFNKEKQKAFLNHPTLVSNIVNKIFPNDKNISEIIKYHHEEPSGNGLFKLKSHDIFFTPALFNVIHYFSIEIYNKGIFKSDEILDEMSSIFNKDNYLISFKMLKELIQENQVKKVA